MIFEAMVIDNSDFFKTGKIRIRLDNERIFASDMKDLSIDPDKSIRIAGNENQEIDGESKKKIHSDAEAYVSTGTIGCAYDSGVFVLPQPNTYGLVARIGYSFQEYKYVWLGGIVKFNDLEKTIDGPSDKLPEENKIDDEEEFGNKNILSKDDIKDDGPIPNLNNPYSTFVYKQKETHIERNDDDSISDNSKNTLDWTKRELQNMVVVDKNKIYVYHNVYNDDGETKGSAVVNIDNNNGVSITYTNDDLEAKSKFNLKSNGTFSIKNSCHKDVDVENEITGGLDSINISHQHDKISAMVFMGESENNFSGGGKDAVVDISVAKEGNSTPEQISMSAKNGINITSNGNITINPGANGQLTLGTGDKYIVTADKMPNTSVKVDGQTFYISNSKA